MTDTRLTFLYNIEGQSVYGAYQCECGVVKKIANRKFRAGHTRSCGCLQKEKTALHRTTHGHHGHPLYPVWQNMKNRCKNPNTTCYYRYGGRGIAVCKEWEDFRSFFDWAINAGWQQGLQLDRTNNDGNYEPANCRFVTRSENVFNSSKSIGSFKRFCRENDMDYNLIRDRLRNGWGLEKAISEPKRWNRSK